MEDCILYNQEGKGYVDVEDNKIFCIRSATRSVEALKARQIAEDHALTHGLVLLSRMVEDNTDYEGGFAIKEWYA